MKIVFVSVVTIISFTALLIGLEIIFTLSNLYPLSPIDYDNKTVWRFSPNHILSKSSSFVKINCDGFRDEEFYPKKEPRISKVFFLGDSYPSALSIADSLIFPNVFERIINSTTSEKKVDVMNTSVSAWSTDQQYRYLIEEGMDLKPDIVLLIMSPNDFRESFMKKLYRLKTVELVYEGLWIPMKERWGWKLSARSHFFQYLQKKVLYTNYGSFRYIYDRRKVNFGKGDSLNWDLPLFLKQPFQVVDSAFELNFRLIQKIKQTTDESGAQFIMTLIPTLMEFDGTLNDTAYYESGIVNRKVKTFAEANDIAFIDLYSQINKLENQRRLYLENDYHFSEEGHTVIAALLADFFLKME